MLKKIRANFQARASVGAFTLIIYSSTIPESFTFLLPLVSEELRGQNDP